MNYSNIKIKKINTKDERSKTYPFRFNKPPTPLLKAKLDNIAIVSASMLPKKAKYQSIANNLPSGEILICLPSSDTQARKAFEKVANQFKSKGHTVTTMSAEGI